MKVEYVLFREQLPFRRPRTDEHDFISIAQGSDLRFKDVIWDIEVDEAHTHFDVVITDSKTGQDVRYVVPTINARVYRLASE